MSQLKDQRRRAINLLKDNLREDNVTEIDLHIDTYLRKIFELPARPTGAKPYAGWMVGGKPPDNSPTRTSQKGIDLIKRYEGLRTNAYLCPAGVLTIGYGHTKTVTPQMTISPLKAEQLLKQDLVRFEDAVNKYVKVPISQGQFDALVSFSFNVGTGAFANSTLLKLLNKGRYDEAAAQFKRWTLANGSRLPGLVRRRTEEAYLFQYS